MKITGFRDPSAWRQDDWYYMAVGSGVAKVGGCVLLYRTKDMKSWEYMHQIASGARCDCLDDRSLLTHLHPTDTRRNC